jgi:hypothetical protein
MSDQPSDRDDEHAAPTTTQPRPNISTDHQPPGSARNLGPGGSRSGNRWSADLRGMKRPKRHEPSRP